MKTVDLKALEIRLKPQKDRMFALINDDRFDEAEVLLKQIHDELMSHSVLKNWHCEFCRTASAIDQTAMSFIHIRKKKIRKEQYETAMIEIAAHLKKQNRMIESPQEAEIRMYD